MSEKQLGGMLLAVSLFGGMTAALTKGAVDVVPPVLFASIRFFIAFTVLLALRRKHIVKSFRRDNVKPVAFLSLFMGLGFIFYNWSMLYTSATNACFFYSLSTLMIPFLAKLINGTSFRNSLFAGLGITVIGMYFLITDGGSFQLNGGDLLALVSAVFFSLQVVFTGRYVERVDPVVMADLQFLLVAVFTLIVSVISGENLSLGAYGLPEWSAILFAGVLGTAVLYLTQSMAQTKLRESTVGIIYAFVPLFTAATAWAVLGERLTGVGMFGGALMIGGVILASKLNSAPVSERTPE